MSAAVTSMSVIASHWSTTQRGRRSPDEVADLLAEDAGVGEEQRRLPAVDEDVGQLLGASGTGRMLCQPSRPSTRPSTSPWGHQLRWKNSRIDSTIGDHDALEHAEEHDAGGGDERQRERRPPDLPVATERAEVDQRQRRRDDDGGQRRSAGGRRAAR